MKPTFDAIFSLESAGVALSYFVAWLFRRKYFFQVTALFVREAPVQQFFLDDGPSYRALTDCVAGVENDVAQDCYVLYVGLVYLWVEGGTSLTDEARMT
jgi:hypothetical protein